MSMGSLENYLEFDPLAPNGIRLVRTDARTAMRRECVPIQGRDATIFLTLLWRIRNNLDDLPPSESREGTWINGLSRMLTDRMVAQNKDEAGLAIRYEGVVFGANFIANSSADNRLTIFQRSESGSSRLELSVVEDGESGEFRYVKTGSSRREPGRRERGLARGEIAVLLARIPDLLTALGQVDGCEEVKSE